MRRKLTIKQEKFCQKYIECGNASDAYRYAYNTSRMKDNTIIKKAYDELKKDYITTIVAEMRANLSKKMQVTKEMIIDEHRKIAFSSIAHLHKTWMELKDFESLTDDQKAYIKSIKTKKEKRMTPLGDDIDVIYIHIELYDKQRSLDTLSKMLGFDTPTKIEVTGNITPTFNIEIIDNSKQVDGENTDDKDI